MRYVLVVLLSTLLVTGCERQSNSTDSGSSTSGPPTMALASVTGDGIRAHMEVLASDEMLGREAGTENFLKAAGYVADQYRATGLEPLGDNGSYFQEIEFLETRLVPDSASMVLHKDEASEALQFRDDFIRWGGFGDTDQLITAPLAFVGFGIRAPEYEHDDYAGIDVTGKILVMLSGAPPHFATDQRAYYSSRTGKRTTAVEQGAVGIITVRTPGDQERIPWSRILSAVGSKGMRWTESDGSPHNGFVQLKGSAALSAPAAQRMFSLAGRDLDALFELHGSGATGSFDLEMTATLGRQSEQRIISSPNVLGLLRGSDPTLQDEYLIFTAHLDHIGLRPTEGDDDIHNGAYDNAAGVAAVLEIAEAMASLSPSPRRSVIFAMVTAEEKGLQGSDYLAQYPPVPIDDIVANINIDMPYLGFPIADVEGFGAEHSTIQNALERATESLDLESSPDSMPAQVRFIRSDQFSFVKRGVPAVAIKSGSMSTDSEIDGSAIVSSFLKDHYHKPSDDLDLPYDPEGAQRFVQVGLMLGLIVANDDDAPQWNEGDFFGDLFGRKELDD